MGMTHLDFQNPNSVLTWFSQAKWEGEHRDKQQMGSPIKECKRPHDATGALLLTISVQDNLNHTEKFILNNKSIGWCKKCITPLLMHWSYIFLALSHWNGDIYELVRQCSGFTPPMSCLLMTGCISPARTISIMNIFFLNFKWDGHNILLCFKLRGMCKKF